jgi:hypothetical protein
VDYIIGVDRAPDAVVEIYRKSDDARRWLSWLVLSVISDKSWWKRPARGALVTEDLNTAKLLLDALVYLCGGGWIIRRRDPAQEH